MFAQTGRPRSSTHLSLGVGTLVHGRKYTEGNTDSSISFTRTADLRLSMCRRMHRQAWGWDTARCEAGNTLCVTCTYTCAHKHCFSDAGLTAETYHAHLVFFFRGAEDCFMGRRGGSMVRAKPVLPEDLSSVLVLCWDL